MDYLEAKINQLVVEKAEEQKTFVRSFTTKPAGDLEGKIGKIFGLIEIESTPPRTPALIDLIIDEIKNNYYHQQTDIKEEELLTITDRFEAALKRTNLAVASFLEIEQISLDLEKVNIIIALLRNQELHFTLVGNLGAILFYNVSRNNYRIINILETSQSPLATPDALKLFSQIISGRMKPRDVLFITTTNLLDYFSLERIKNVLTSQLPADGITELSGLMEEVSDKENFGALAIELEKATVPVKKAANIQEFDYRQAASEDSIKELTKTEKETEKLLTPSILPEIKKYAGSFKAALKNYLQKAKTGSTTFYKSKKQKVTIQPNLSLKSKFSLRPPTKSLIKTGTTLKSSAQLITGGAKKPVINFANQPIWSKLSFSF